MLRGAVVTPSRTLSAFAGVTSFLATLQVLCLGSGALGIRCAQPLAIIFITVAALLSILFAARFWPSSCSDAHFRNLAQPAVRAGGGHLRTVVAALTIVSLAWTASLWTRLWMLARLRPPYDWDGLYYHLPAISGWAARGHVSWLAGSVDVPFVNFPMGVEATTFIMHRALGTSRLVTACNLWYWPLAFLALVVLASALGARRGWQYLAGAWLAAAPVFICQSVTCYTDPGFAATVMAALAATVILVLGGEIAARWRLALWGMSVGLLAGAKGTGAPFAVMFAVTALIAVIAVHGWHSWRRWALRMLAAACIVIAVGGYWYVRNALATGNPIHPIELRFGDKVIFPGYDYVAFSEANLPAWLAAYPAPFRMFVSWLQLDAPISGYAPVGGLGYLWIACVPAVLLLAVILLRRRSDPRAIPFAILAGCSLALLFIQTSAWWSRFTVWLLALGLPSAVILLQMGFEGARRGWQRAAIVLVAVAAASTVVWESNRTLEIEQRTGRVPGSGSPHYLSTAQAFFPGLEETAGIDAFMAAPSVARSPWGRLGTLYAGVLAMPLGARVIAILPADPHEADIRRLHDAGITWVVWDEVGAGRVPDPLSRDADEEIVYHPAPDANFHFLHLRAGEHQELGER